MKSNFSLKELVVVSCIIVFIVFVFASIFIANVDVFKDYEIEDIEEDYVLVISSSSFFREDSMNSKIDFNIITSSYNEYSISVIYNSISKLRYESNIKLGDLNNKYIKLKLIGTLKEKNKSPKFEIIDVKESL